MIVSLGNLRFHLLHVHRCQNIPKIKLKSNIKNKLKKGEECKTFFHLLRRQYGVEQERLVREVKRNN